MKKVVIDCRYLGMSGIGRFLECIIDNLDFTKYEISLLGKKDFIDKYTNCKCIYDDTSPFSSKALFKTNTKIINKHDIFFSPNFIIPFGVKIKTITVLHDIIFLDMPEVNNSFIEKSIKKYLLKRCVKKSSTIFTVSNFSKERICYHLKKAEPKIVCVYQGVAKQFMEYDTKNVKENYIVYVGNIKKHKGLNTLLKAYEHIKEKIDLIIVGDAFGFKNGDKETLKLIESLNVKFTGRIKDAELLDVISKAKFLIQPSFYEGFGLPPMEALYLNTKPIISDIPVFKEVYSDLPVVFFKSKNSDDLATKILNSDSSVAINKEELNKKFSYYNFAKEIEKSF